ncbi:hypothetical protein [Syntrophomonas palmitatica]|uniref:hypothetical protein n=1 Tax=Syntrophomonas palmitatica TaxID=402877 RepID=UPI0006D0CFAC|nr:hypothetical protein [Syntrophomonas palmitatica]
MLKKSRFKFYLVCMLVMSLILMPAALAGAQGENIGAIQDDELVVCQLDDSSQISNVQVLDNLKISGAYPAEIKDGMNYGLSSIRNLYSSEKIQKGNGYVGVQAGASAGGTFKDLYYLAALEKEEIGKIKMPVGVKVNYYLDDQEIAPSKLAGRSGHLKIVCQLENLTGETRQLELVDAKGNKYTKEAEVFTPFVVSLSGWEFDNKKFRNIVAPGKAGESPQGVIANVKGTTSVTWSVPLVPPKYPAKQYTILEADAKDIELPSYKIAVIPILPTTSEIDSLGKIQDSFGKLYDGFDQIQKGIGARNQDATLLYGLNAIKDGLGQVSGGLGTLVDKMKMIRGGLSNSAFDASTYNAATGADAKGNKPGVQDAVRLLKDGVKDRALPAYALQKMVLGMMEQSIGKAGDAVQEPSASTTLYNDIVYLKNQVSGPQQAIISKTIEPKLNNMATNIKAYRDGGSMVTSTGSMPFPASVKALEEGSNATLAALEKIDSGLGMMIIGVGMLDKDGQPMKIMVDGKPGSIMYALSYMQASIDNKMVPGINKLTDGAGKIGTGAGGAKEAIAGGLQTFQAIGPTVSALAENASKTDTFLGKPEGAKGSVMYVFQTPEVSKKAATMNYALGVIVLALIVLIATGRPPKQVFDVPVEHA